jgi:hypothetical protein
LEEAKNGLFGGSPMNDAAAARAAANRARVAAENEAAAAKARQMQVERAQREELVLKEAERAMLKAKADLERRALFEKRLEEAKLDCGCLLPELVLHIMSFLSSSQLRRFRLVCFWAARVSAPLFESAFCRERPRQTVWRCQKSLTWNARCCKAVLLKDGLQNLNVQQSDVVILTPGGTWFVSSFFLHFF